jgi:putative MATE family efflux protein
MVCTATFNRQATNMKKYADYLRKYFVYGWPIILSQAIIFIVNNYSASLTGALSAKAMSGYTIGQESYTVLTMLALGLTGGFHVYISQYYGAHDKQKYNQVLRLGMKLCLAVGLAYCALIFFLARPFARLYAQDEVIVGYAVDYLRVYCFTFPFYFINLLWSETYSFIGRGKITMVSGVLNCIVNIIANYLCCQVLDLGIRGVALGSLCGRIAEFLFLYFTLNQKDSEFNLFVKYPAAAAGEMVEILKTSLPLVLNESIFSLAMMGIMMNYGYVSEEKLACLTVVNNISQLFFILNKGSGPAVGVMVGGELGKGDFAAAQENARLSLYTVVLTTFVGAVPLAQLAGQIPAYYHLEGELAALCTQMIRANCVIGTISSLTMTFYNILRMGGDTVAVFCQDGLFYLVVILPVSYIFSHLVPLPFFWLYVVVNGMNDVKALVGYYFYRKKKWLHKLS